MSEESDVQYEISRLETARSKVKTEQGYAERERDKVNSAYSGVRKWKGAVWDEIRSTDVQGGYNEWIWRWGWHDDGSINGVADRLNDEIGKRKGLLERIRANAENIFS